MKTVYIVRVVGACIFAMGVYMYLHSFNLSFVARFVSVFGK